jgi:signal transduction histidine kinase
LTGPSHPDLRILFGSFVAVAVTFAAANAYGLYAIARVDAASDAIAYDSAPSIEHLAALRTAVRQTELLLERAVRDDAKDEAVVGAEKALEQVNAEARAYLALPRFPGELEQWNAVEVALEDFERAVHHAAAHREGRAAALLRSSLAEVATAADRLLTAASRAIEFNAQNEARLALGIKAVRSRSSWAVLVLNASCVLFTLVAGLLVLRQVRRYGALVDEHAALQDLRASELESFAGRAAHDILNPVAATQLALQLAAQRAGPDASGRELLDRALRNVMRVRTIVDGLLAFARAGARPRPGESADLAAVVEDVAAGLRPGAERTGVDLAVEPLPAVSVRCSPGVLTSLVSNLVNNAIKYAGARQAARIRVRARHHGATVHVEVEDNGPGLPPDAIGDIFLPWVRGPTSAGREGLGLGLATVRRLAESHGGEAGVRSVVGEGSVFWFELPAATGASSPRLARTAGAAEPARLGGP